MTGRGVLCLIAALGSLAVVSAGCTGSSGPGRTNTSTHTQVVTKTRPAPNRDYRPPAPHPVPPLAPGHPAPPNERDARCPYIRTGLDQTPNTGVNLADLEGDRVYRTTVLTRYRPVGCRFYFYAPPYEAIADVVPHRLPSAPAARNAMVLTARSGTELITQRHFVDGLTGILYRTRFYKPDGARDWAFVFTKGRLLVVVHTQRADTSRNALYIGRAIARRI